MSVSFFLRDHPFIWRSTCMASTRVPQVPTKTILNGKRADTYPFPSLAIIVSFFFQNYQYVQHSKTCRYIVKYIHKMVS